MVLLHAEQRPGSQNGLLQPSRPGIILYASPFDRLGPNSGIVQIYPERRNAFLTDLRSVCRLVSTSTISKRNPRPPAFRTYVRLDTEKMVPQPGGG